MRLRVKGKAGKVWMRVRLPLGDRNVSSAISRRAYAHIRETSGQSYVDVTRDSRSTLVNLTPISCGSHMDPAYADHELGAAPQSPRSLQPNPHAHRLGRHEWRRRLSATQACSKKVRETPTLRPRAARRAPLPRCEGVPARGRPKTRSESRARPRMSQRPSTPCRRACRAQRLRARRCP